MSARIGGGKQGRHNRNGSHDLAIHPTGVNLTLEDFRQTLTATERQPDSHSHSSDFGGMPRAIGHGGARIRSEGRGEENI
jgi:hypothetical protein